MRPSDRLFSLMLHAPADPQHWFTPTMQTKRPVVPQPKDIQDKKVRNDVFLAFDCGADPLTPEGIAWVEMQTEANKTAVVWDREYRKQLCIQWPRAWAEAVLTELNERCERSMLGEQR